MLTSNKVFVIDTNVILHDYRAIFNFEDNDIVIPIIVLEELDKFKKGNDIKNFQAREFMRELDRLSENVELGKPMPLGTKLGLLHIETGKPFSKKLKESFDEVTPDHKILATAEYLQNKYLDKKVILVTQDINLRMKSRSLGINSQDYKTGKIENTEKLFQGIETIHNISDNLINSLHKEESILMEDTQFDKQFYAHEYIILKGDNSSVLAHFDPFEKRINRIIKSKSYGIIPRNAEQAFTMDALTRSEIKLVTVTGKAGTGKTLLALAAALEQRRDFHQIFLSRPIVPLANRDLGFLPGNEKEKITPYMQPLFDNLTVIKQKVGMNSKDTQKIDKMLAEDKLLITPLAYIRGRSLSNVFFIVDEAQNLTPHEVKTIITRAGEGTKLVFTGDIEQIDSPYLDMKSNGLSYLTDKMKGQDVFAHINLIKGERSHLADLASRLL